MVPSWPHSSNFHTPFSVFIWAFTMRHGTSSLSAPTNWIENPPKPQHHCLKWYNLSPYIISSHFVLFHFLWAKAASMRVILSAMSDKTFCSANNAAHSDGNKFTIACPLSIPNIFSGPSIKTSATTSVSEGTNKRENSLIWFGRDYRLWILPC